MAGVAQGTAVQARAGGGGVVTVGGGSWCRKTQ